MRPGAFGRQRRACPSWNRSRIHLSSTFREGSESLVLNAKPIPLTLTLSHGEREQPAAGSVVRGGS